MKILLNALPRNKWSTLSNNAILVNFQSVSTFVIFLTPVGTVYKEKICICEVTISLLLLRCWQSVKQVLPEVTWEEPRRHPLRQRMDSPASCATSCAMPTTDESNHSAAGTTHPQCSASATIADASIYSCKFAATRDFFLLSGTTEATVVKFCTHVQAVLS